MVSFLFSLSLFHLRSIDETIRKPNAHTIQYSKITFVQMQTDLIELIDQLIYLYTSQLRNENNTNSHTQTTSHVIEHFNIIQRRKRQAKQAPHPNRRYIHTKQKLLFIYIYPYMISVVVLIFVFCLSSSISLTYVTEYIFLTFSCI